MMVRSSRSMSGTLVMTACSLLIWRCAISRALLTESHSPIEMRSEEHTSELQSLMRISYAVFCLKKKKAKNEKMQPRTKPELIILQTNKHTITNKQKYH